MMQFRIRNSEAAAANNNSRSKFRMASSALFVAGSILLASVALGDAFVPSNIASRVHCKTTSMQLHYTMPDVTSMKAREIRQELESYGINTNTLFDKREFEEALIEARRHYEQTLDDVMASTRPKKKVATQAKRRTVNYQRGQHRDERIYSTDVNTGPQQQQQQQQRRHHYQAAPDPVGGFHTYPNGAPQPPHSRRRPGNEWFEEDPLFAHERNQGYSQQEHFHDYRQEEHYQGYEVGGRNRPRNQATYNDPAMEMKYQAALAESYNMKVEDLQHQLNIRGISTKYCMIFKDFCMEYAKAMAEDMPVVKSVEELEEEEVSSIFDEDDDDYDPTYRDVVMQKYDPSMWI